MEIFDGLTAWDIILVSLACWLLLTLFSCMQKVKQDSEKAYLTFGSGLVILGGLSGWLAYYLGSAYYLFWGAGGGTILTLLLIRTSAMREFRNLFLQNFAGTFWGCWLPSHYRSGRRAYRHVYSIDDERPDYSREPWQNELAERHADGVRVYGTFDNIDTNRNSEGLPLTTEDEVDWNAAREENERYDMIPDRDWCN